MPWKTCHWKRETCKKKPPLVASSFMGILSYYLLCKLIYDHSSCGVSICQIGLVLVFQMRPISCPSDKMSIEVGSSARCGKNWQSRQPRGCRELLLSRPTPKLTQHAPRPSAYQDLYLQHHTHTQVLDFKKWKAILGFQSNIKDSSMPLLHPLPRQCTKFTPWTLHTKYMTHFCTYTFIAPLLLWPPCLSCPQGGSVPGRTGHQHSWVDHCSWRDHSQADHAGYNGLCFENIFLLDAKGKYGKTSKIFSKENSITLTTSSSRQ